MTIKNKLDFTITVPSNFWLQPLNTADQENILALNPSDSWRNNDRAEFHYFYERVKLNITDLTAKLQSYKDFDRTIPAVLTLLKVHAHIANSYWGSNLRKSQSEEYSLFEQDIQNLQREALRKAVFWASHDPENRNEILRWMQANPTQRRFAAYCNLEKVPYRYEEVPAGAVYLSNATSYHIGTLRLKDGFKDWSKMIHSKYQELIKTVRGQFCKLMTGKINDHAELSLGSGTSFDLTKDDEKGIHLKLQQRTGKTCFSDIVAPDKEKMLAAHKARFPNTDLRTFDALWSAIDQEARAHVDEIKSTFGEIISCNFSYSKRPPDYDCTQSWSPGNIEYSCSGTVNALLSKFGIDIGEELGKVNKKITPADFMRSKYFRPFYLTTNS